MDIKKSLVKNSFYIDDVLDQMEKGELNTDIFRDGLFEKASLNQRLVNTSKHFLKFYRQNSDTSLDLNMSISSEKSSDSKISYENFSPYIEESEQFNWELSTHDYESKIDDSKLNQFYGEYRTISLDKIKKNKETNITSNTKS